MFRWAEAFPEKEGQYPSLSPDGDFVAFINNAVALVVTSLVTRASRELAVHWRTVVGLGPWSPDGAFLLAAMTGGFSVFTKLAVVDCATGDFREIVPRVVEGDRGGQSAWAEAAVLDLKPGGKPGGNPGEPGGNPGQTTRFDHLVIAKSNDSCPKSSRHFRGRPPFRGTNSRPNRSSMCRTKSGVWVLFLGRKHNCVILVAPKKVLLQGAGPCLTSPRTSNR